MPHQVEEQRFMTQYKAQLAVAQSLEVRKRGHCPWDSGS